MTDKLLSDASSDPHGITTSLIWSDKHCAWWTPDARRYTIHTSLAGRWSYQEARRLTVDCKPEEGISIMRAPPLKPIEHACPNCAPLIAALREVIAAEREEAQTWQNILLELPHYDWSEIPDIKEKERRHDQALKRAITAHADLAAIEGKDAAP